LAYIGTKPTIGNFQICDAISVVNGQAAYTMQVGGVNVSPQSSNHMIVSLNGTIQKPGGANPSFTVSGSTITFASNLATGDVIDFIQILGDVLDLGVPSDATVSTAKLADNAVTAAKITDSTITAAKLASGTVQNQSAFKNIIINGDMSVAQRGTSTSSITSDNTYPSCDRWKLRLTTLGTWTQSQSTTVPTGQGFATSLKMDCTTADASPAAGDRVFVKQAIEGQNLQYLKKGTSSAESTTVSFWVRSNKTGTYICEFYDEDNSRSISKSYTISSADTWEKKELTFAGDTTGAFGNDNGDSLGLHFWLGTGTTYSSGTLNTSWGTATNANRAVGQVNLADSTSNEWYVTGVQFEAGTSASDFEFLPVDVNLNRCQRYYFQYLSGTSKTVGIASYWTTTGVDTIINFPVEMRSAPSVVATSGSSYYTVYVAGNGRAIDAGLAVNRTNLTSTQLYATTASDTEGRAGLWTSTNSSASIAFSSEL
jgi:hypothetical protein